MKKFLLPFLIVSLTSCAGYHLRKGEEAYARLAFEKAGLHYDKALKHPQPASVHAHAAEAARLRNDPTTAVTQFRIADSLSALRGDDAMHYGQVLMELGHKKEAADFFLRVLSEQPENRTAQDLIFSCQGDNSFYKDSARFVVNELVLPGVKNVFSATPFMNGLLVAGEKESGAAKANPWNGLSFLDLYYAEKKTIVTWLEAQPLKGEVNGPWHEGPAVVSGDGRTMYFTRSNYYERKLGKDAQNTSHLKLFRATLDEKNEWSDIRAFGFNGEDFSTGHPALSRDGKTLYFASDRSGGRGGSDIWMSTDLGTGWGEPVNLGPMINTPGNELFPTINGTSLYFSSTALENMGGLDIFESHQEGAGWSEPVNLNYPVNTTHDDFAFVLDSTGKSGFLSSNRGGNDRVYSFLMTEATYFVEGEVTGDSGVYLPNTEVILTAELTGEDVVITTDAQGKFQAKLKANTDYSVKAVHDDMISTSMSISTKGLPNGSKLQADFNLRTIVIDQPLAVDNIYFDYDSWDIRPDAANELDKLARLFIDNPHLSFELSSHTDSRGGSTYNLVLSDARAYSTVNYLIQRGVDPDRIIGRGYGEATLVNHCKDGVKCTEEEHQSNRRTEFKVVQVNSVAQH